MSETTQAPVSAASEPAPQLRGNLNAVGITFMVIAAAAPLTVVGGLIPIAFLLGNGVGLPVMFLAAAAILALFAVGLLALSRYIPRSGSFFTFVAHGLGRTTGAGAAYLALLCYTTVQVAVFSYLGATIGSSIALLGGPDVPWWLFTLASIGVVGYLGYRQIELSSKVLSIVLLAEMGIVLVLGIFIMVVGGPEGFSMSPFSLQNILSGSPALGLMFALAGFIGFESTVVYRSEARNPDRTIPRATYGSAAVIGLFYAFGAWIMIMGFGESAIIDEAAADPTTLLARLTDMYLGPVGSIVIAVLFMGSMFAAVLSLHNVLTRYHHFMGLARLLPSPLTRVHARFGSPHLASLTQVVTAALFVIVLVLIGFSAENLFAWGAGIGTLAIVILMALTCISVIAFFAKNRVGLSRWHTTIAPLLAFIGLSVAGVLIAMNFPLLVNDVDAAGQPTWGIVSVVLVGAIICTPLVGIVQAQVLKRRNPDAYEQITEKLEDA